MLSRETVLLTMTGAGHHECMMEGERQFGEQGATAVISLYSCRFSVLFAEAIAADARVVEVMVGRIGGYIFRTWVPNWS